MIVKRPRAEEAHILSLVAADAAALHVAPPHVRFVTRSSGPCYEALFNRIELDRATLALPEPLLRIVVAHEVGHATQRGTMLLDFAWTVLSVTMLLSIPCIVFALSPDQELWRVSVPGFAFVVAFFVCGKIWRTRSVERSDAFELDADAKAASLCGAASALAALEAMSTRGHIDTARLDAMRARLISNSR
ncbi:Protease HtpX [Caballeronia novacaledonica]|uniref:Protease HtpX n=1 Tax=Caballeronia novacaledonica TaxID=1544861 RepID=A0A2U3I0D8_9BURK|nr:M48 family metalloprotease [Caballeronia novacaledonica]SPB13561.1 Protease HtpX [Caballeronia novacaledonica]